MSDQRTNAEAERETIVAERAGMLSFARRYVGGLDPLLAAGKIKGEDATELKDRILSFADMLANGFHREDLDPDGVRAAMRALIKGDA